MALQLDYQIADTSVVVSNAYWMIQGISGGKEGFDINILVFASQLDRELGASHIGVETYFFMPWVDSAGYFIDTDTNFVEQAYLWLKELPEFAGCTDV